MRLRELRARHCESRADGVSLLRHRRRAAAARLGDLCDFGLSEQRDVAADLLRRVCGRGQRGTDLGDAPTIRVPRKDRLCESEVLRVEADDLEPPIAERRERPCRAAQLRCEALLSYGLDARARLDHRDQPARGLEPERRRHRLLEERACGHRRRPVSPRERGAPGREPIELREDEVERPTADEHRRRVDDVLARRAEVDVVGGVADRSAQLANQRLRGVSDLAARVGDGRGVEQLGAARSGDPRSSVLGNQAERCTGVC